LQVWERAHKLTLDVYAATRMFPKEEVYGLTSQLRRAASSIPANIAEGCGRNGDAELARFLSIAIGSANELDYHLLLARDLGYLPSERHQNLSAEVQAVTRMLASFIDRVRQQNGRQPSRKSLIADSR
jgi:four helix bundle protein